MESNSRHMAPAGDLTIFEAAEFKSGLLKLFENEGLVSLDLSKVTRVDTSIIQLLWAARKQGRMFVSGVTPDLQSKLAHLGFSEPLSE
ncbi:MAG: STAS domain-containing protein [Nitrospira sp.]|nr:STAS domain-containing protein [Nitrospira sp.]